MCESAKTKGAARAPLGGYRIVLLLWWIHLLRSIQLLASRVWTFGNRHDRQRRLQAEIQDGFGRQFYLLTFGRGLHAATDAAAGSSPDGRSFTAAGNAADDGADGCSGTHFGCCVLAARTAFALVLISLNAVRLVPNLNSIELKDEFRSPCKFARALHVDDMALHVISGGDDNISVHGEWSVERGFEGLSGLCCFGTDLIHEPNR